MRLYICLCQACVSTMATSCCCLQHAHKRTQNDVPRKTHNFSRFIYLDINQRERSTRFVIPSRACSMMPITPKSPPADMRPSVVSVRRLTLWSSLRVITHSSLARASNQPIGPEPPQKAQSLHLAATLYYIYIYIYICGVQSYKDVSDFCIQMAFRRGRVDQDRSR